MSIDTTATLTKGLAASSSVVNLNEGTFVMWTKVTWNASFAANYYFFDTDTARHAFLTNGANKWEMYNDGRDRNFNVAGLYSSGDVIHCAFAYNKTGNVQNAYLNGTALSVSSTTGTWGSNSLGSNLNIAVSAAGGNAGRQYVRSAAIYDRVLDPQEIKALANKASPLLIAPDSLTAYWELYDRNWETRPIVGGVSLVEEGTLADGDVNEPIIRPTAQIIPFPSAAAAGGRTVSATTATMSAADYSATINLKRELASTLATMGMASYAATVSSGRAISANLATMIMADGAADVITSRDVLGTLGTMEAAAQVFTLTNDMNVSAALATLAATGNAADVNLNRQVAATLATLEGATAAADVERKRVIECTVALLCICALKSNITGPIPPPPDGLRRALIGMVGRGATRRRGTG